MLIDSASLRPSSSLCRAAAIALFTCASALGLQAQQSDAGQAAAPVQFTSPNYRLDLKNVDLNSLDLSDGVSYSSSATPIGNPETANLEFKGLDGLQPPPRRRYGRPRYNDSNHNPDGSPKYAFIAGIGASIPVGNLHKYLTTSYGFQVGAGRNFNKNFGVLAQFDYDHFGFQGSTLANQTALYNTGCTTAAGCTAISGLDGASHIWSVTVDPTYSIFSRESMGAYVVAGVGFYHKTANFTVPATGVYCDPYYGCYQYAANQTIDKYSSNAVGFNGGVGLTFKPSRFANERFYIEGRYVYVDNSKRVGYTVANVNTTLYNGNNFYPANSNRSSYIPVKVGIRF
jgi:hypothetical protein